jgi:PilZ domain
MVSAHEFMSGSRMMGTAIERRTAVRYQLRAPVTFESVEDQIAKPGAGFVQNISTEGVFVLCPRLLSVGDLIELEILLPPFETYDPKLVVSYIGLIVRVADERGFAVTAKVSLHRYIMGRRVPIPDEESE